MRQVDHILITFALGLIFATAPAQADELSNGTFLIRYDESGIQSLRRTRDVHDTDYIAQNARLGRLLVRYRTAPNGDWLELRDALLQPRAAGGPSIEYALGTRLPTLASKASPMAERGVGGLRALNDGLVPAEPGGGRGGRGGGPGGAPQAVPLFTWTPGPNEPGAGGPGEAGVRRWVQYTFPVPEEVSRTQVFWAAPPRSWRLLYQDGDQWSPVEARSPYGSASHEFITVDFAPVKTMALRIEIVMPESGAVSVAEWRVGPDPQLVPAADLDVRQTFTLKGDALVWTIAAANLTTRSAEISDLAVPLPFAERVAARGDIYTKKLMRHALVAGHGSWVFWQRSNGEGPYLLLTPRDGAAFEYFDSSGGGFGTFTPYVHADGARQRAAAAGGNWRLPTSTLQLAPKGSAGSSITYSFRFRWTPDIAGIRDALVEEGKFDTAAVPGMVVPTDLSARFALRTRNAIAAVDAEHAASTRLRLVEKKDDTSVYEVQFSKLGENLLTVRYGDGQWTTLEFFATEPLETVIKKRAAFLVSHHQHRDPDKWYYGVYSDWDQKNEVLRGPEDRDGLSAWLTDANDDAGNARPAFIASKNVFFPDRKEIESLELYISRYLWGGMQMTDEEKYPYAIYGIPNFMANRSSPDEGRNGRAHVWRIYDYPHIVMLYYRMHQIAKFYPDQVRHLDAAQYLERAYRTAVAYWTVPIAIEKWSADAVGTMNEAFIPELIDTLEEEGRTEWAATLRRFWEGKVDRFITRTPNLYGSEFAFDSTGFESTGAFAKYAMDRLPPPGQTESRRPATAEFRSRISYDAALKFMNFQLLLNTVVRGWLETTYYQLGSDYRGNMTYLLSYMSQMGGWSILDYALHFATDPTDSLRLGYASTLSSWALVNSGTKESGYGYWFPSRNNDGATGGGFMPEAIGGTWIGKTMPRGAWFYSAEEDVGYCGALRAHATVVARDPVFGEMAYGGVLTREGDAVRVIPRDGLRVRFHVVRDTQRLHLVLDHDGFAKEQPVVVRDDLSRIEFRLENRTGPAHQAGLTIAGLPPGRYDVLVDGRRVAGIEGTHRDRKVLLPIGAAAAAAVVIARTAQ